MRLQAKNLVVGYGAKTVFGDIDFTANAGEMVALLGVNGIGKSTLLKTLSGALLKQSGSLLISGKELSELNVQQRALQLSVVLTEKLWLDNMLVKDFIALGRAPHTGSMGTLTLADKQIVERVIENTRATALAAKFFNELSDGEKQKVLIARALCQDTPVIVLDEPTAFLDFRNRYEVLKLLKRICVEEGKTVVLSTHDIENSLEVCRKCWIMTEEKRFIEKEIKDKTDREEVKRILFSGA
ncbi:MAG: ABC transporter ATP-binding protein [Chitinophagales bacterium]